MTINLDRDLLKTLGLGALGAEDAQLLLTVVHERLQRHVGYATVARMTTTELGAFEAALALGGGESLAALERSVPDYRDVVVSAFETIKAELAANAPTVLQVCGHGSTLDHDPWRHRRPDAGPTLVGAPQGWCSVTSPLAQTTVASDPTGSELYARRADCPPVVLRVPDAHRIDPTTLWCDDNGEIRVGFATHSDLRWRLADRPTSALVDYDKVLRRRRRPLEWADVYLKIDGFGKLEHGRWRIEDGPTVRVEDRGDGTRFRLEPLHDRRHWNVVEPHFTPDGSQLVAVFNTDDPSEGCGVHACSVGYLDAIKQSANGRDRRWPWEHQTWPNDTAPSQPTTRDPGERRPGVGFLEGIGYDPSSTRAAVTDERRTHLYHVRDWVRLGTLDRPDNHARVEAVEIPGGGVPMVAWGGHSLVVAAIDGRIWRLDLKHGAGDLIEVVEAEHSAPVVSANRVGAAALLVYRDRTIVGVDRDGAVERTQLPGDDDATSASVLRDGRVLLVTDAGLELWTGTRLVASVAPPLSPIVGVAPCAGMAEWAIAWHQDRSVSALRFGAGVIRIEHDNIPLMPCEGFEARASGAVMVDVNQWFLLGPAGGQLNEGRSYIAGQESWIDLKANCLNLLEPAGVVVVGTDEGLQFIDPTDDQERTLPRPIVLDGGVHSLATGECARSVAAGGDGVLWLVRLLI